MVINVVIRFTFA